MTQSRLIKNAQQVLKRHEQRHALALAACERQVRDNETKLAELERYREVYRRDFSVRAQEGMNGSQALTYQNFIARVALAVDEQHALLQRVREQYTDELHKWRSAARRTAALDRIVARGERAALQHAERSEQAVADAHAQRLWTLKGNRRGN